MMKHWHVLAVACLLALPPAPRAEAAGLEFSAVPMADGSTMEVAIFYPSATPADDVDMGPMTLHVAKDAALLGDNLPLVVLSHGAGGSALSQFDTATALADAGFVVAAPKHQADNYQDPSHTFEAVNFIDRPRQVSALIDFMLRDWHGHAAINPARIGMLGHSAGGTTALLLAGGALDWTMVVGYCADHPMDWACALAHARVNPPQVPMPDQPMGGPDPRIKALVLAAPALIHGFTPASLLLIHQPVQLWIGEEDSYVPTAALLPSMIGDNLVLQQVPQAGHFAYLAPCSDWMAKIAPEICTDPPGFDRAAFLQRFQSDVIAFFRAKL